MREWSWRDYAYMNKTATKVKNVEESTTNQIESLVGRLDNLERIVHLQQREITELKNHSHRDLTSVLMGDPPIGRSGLRRS